MSLIFAPTWFMFSISRATVTTRSVIALRARSLNRLALLSMASETCDAEFNMPTDILVAPNGDLVVLDAGNFRIQILDRDGRFIRQWGEVGDSLGQLARPRGLAMDPDGLIYVSDGFFSNIQVYTPQGRLLLPMGEHSLEVGAGHYALIAGLAVDETSRLYVLDQFFKKIEVIRKLPLSEGQAILARLSR